MRVPLSHLLAIARICDMADPHLPRVTLHQVRCHVCGEPFESVRTMALTCSPRCRQVRCRFRARQGRFPWRGELVTRTKRRERSNDEA